MRLPIAEVEATLRRVFAAVHLPGAEAAVLVDTLLDAELRGVASHGLSRVKMYRQKLANGSITTPAPLLPLADRQAVARWEGGHGLGQWVAHQAMQEAMAKAGRFGIGAVSVRNSQHFGTAGYYAALATERDMVGLAFSNASPRLAPWGGLLPMLGNNPWSVGLPTHVAGLPFVLDISNATSSAGRIRLAQKRGEAIPDNWALDKHGEPTTDPAAALEGILLPFGGHKGYGITLAVSMLTSLLAAGVPDAEVQTMDDPDQQQRVSHFFIAINVDFFVPLDEFRQQMQALVESLHSTPKLPRTERIFYPGERGYLQKRELLASGHMEVDAAVWQGITALPG